MFSAWSYVSRSSGRQRLRRRDNEKPAAFFHVIVNLIVTVAVWFLSVSTQSEVIRRVEKSNEGGTPDSYLHGVREATLGDPFDVRKVAKVFGMVLSIPGVKPPCHCSPEIYLRIFPAYCSTKFGSLSPGFSRISFHNSRKLIQLSRLTPR